MPIPQTPKFLHNIGRASIHADIAPGPYRVGRRRRSRRNLGARRSPRPSRPAPRLHGPHPGPRRTADVHSTLVAALGIRPGRYSGARRRLARRVDARRASRSATPPARAGASRARDLRRGGSVSRRAGRAGRRAAPRGHGLDRPRPRRPREVGARGRARTAARRRGLGLLDRPRVAQGHRPAARAPARAAARPRP